MIALLLNSGRGTRMGGETKEHPKCMCRIDGDETIISWQVKLLKECGITEAVVTTGPFADMLKEHLESLNSGIRFHYVPNPDYASTNYIYSMYLARDLLHDDVISLHGDLVLDPAEHAVTADGEPIVLTLKEFELLRLFLSNPGGVFSREQLLARIWGQEYTGETRTVDVHIRTLRVKLGKYGEHIGTIRGVGYRWETDT